MPAKIYQRILQIGVFVSLGVIFLVFSSLLFPFISSKQLTFNILMELLLPIWLVLIYRYPAFSPMRSKVTWGLGAFLAVILVSCFTGVDFNLSFWGDVERLLGFFHIFHFFLFYLYLITAFRSREDWYWLLSASVAAASIEALIIIFGEKIGTIGNTAYVSGYMIFNLFFAALLCLRTAVSRQWPYYIAIVLMLISFFRADTSGAIIGLGTSLLLLIFLLGLFASRRKVRRGALITFLAAVLAVIALFSQYNQPWFKENAFLKDLSVNKATFQTRRLSWEGAFRDFPAHPWLGTGFGNYAIIFDRQFDPSFFNYSTTETYFDRAHNNLIDIASTTGAIGLLAYLSIFAAAAWSWYRALRVHGFRIESGEAGRPMRELAVVAALFTAYFIQNLAVFDSLPTYMGLMIALGYLIFLVPGDQPEPSEEERGSSGMEWTILIVSSVMVLVIVLPLNTRPWKMLSKVIDAYSYIATGQEALGFQTYQEALAVGTPLDRDARTTLVNLVINNPRILSAFGGKLYENIGFVTGELEKNLALNPDDSLTQMQAAQIYDIAARYYPDDPKTFQAYMDKALAAIEHSLASSPRRIPVYFVKGQILINMNEPQLAEAAFLKARELNQNFIDTACQLGNFYQLEGQKEKAASYVDECVDKQGRSLMVGTIQAAAERYAAAKDATKLMALVRIVLDSGNLQLAASIASQTAEIDKSLKPAVDAFIRQVQEKMSAN
ncbi:MAG: O-antigen ligase family protein [Bacillota bacterium]